MEFTVLVSYKDKEISVSGLELTEEKLGQRFGQEDFSEEDFESVELIEIEGGFLGFEGIARFGGDLNDLHDYAEALEEMDSIEDVYLALDNTDDFSIAEWLPFDEENFRLLAGDDPYEAGRKVYFGNIYSWNDEYIRSGEYGNLETTSELDFNAEAEKIIHQWLDENF